MSNIERNIKDYFIEEIVADTCTGNLNLITEAINRNGQIHLKTRDESWTWQEAYRFVKLCQKLRVEPVPMNAAQ